MARLTQAEKRLQALTKSWRKVWTVCPTGKGGQLAIKVVTRSVRSSRVLIVWYDPEQERDVVVFHITVGVKHRVRELTWVSDTDFVFRSNPRNFWVAEEMYRLARRFYQLYCLHNNASIPL